MSDVGFPAAAPLRELGYLFIPDVSSKLFKTPRCSFIRYLSPEVEKFLCNLRQVRFLRPISFDLYPSPSYRFSKYVFSLTSQSIVYILQWKQSHFTLRRTCSSSFAVYFWRNLREQWQEWKMDWQNSCRSASCKSAVRAFQNFESLHITSTYKCNYSLSHSTFN